MPMKQLTSILHRRRRLSSIYDMFDSTIQQMTIIILSSALYRRHTQSFLCVYAACLCVVMCLFLQRYWRQFFYTFLQRIHFVVVFSSVQSDCRSGIVATAAAACRIDRSAQYSLGLPKSTLYSCNWLAHKRVACNVKQHQINNKENDFSFCFNCVFYFILFFIPIFLFYIFLFWLFYSSESFVLIHCRHCLGRLHQHSSSILLCGCSLLLRRMTLDSEWNCGNGTFFLYRVLQDWYQIFLSENLCRHCMWFVCCTAQTKSPFSPHDIILFLCVVSSIYVLIDFECWRYIFFCVRKIIM